MVATDTQRRRAVEAVRQRWEASVDYCYYYGCCGYCAAADQQYGRTVTKVVDRLFQKKNEQVIEVNLSSSAIELGIKFFSPG